MLEINKNQLLQFNNLNKIRILKYIALGLIKYKDGGWANGGNLPYSDGFRNAFKSSYSPRKTIEYFCHLYFSNIVLISVKFIFLSPG